MSEILSGGDGGNFITAADIAATVSGELLGSGSGSIRAIAPLDRAGQGDVSFLASARYAEDYLGTSAGVVLIRPEFRDLATRAPARIVVSEPHDAILRLLPVLYPEAGAGGGVHPTAVIGRGATLADGASVGPYVVVGDGAKLGARSVVRAHAAIGAGVEIGDDCLVHAGATLYSGTVLGNRVIVHSGARVGSDGFGYLSGADGHRKIRHVGRCVIGDDVEIGANTTIDRGSVDDTVVGAGTKIDNLVHIAHNVRIGQKCLILAQVGIAGSCRIEDGAVLAGQVGVSGHLTIGAGAKLGAQAGVICDIPPNETWSGYPARPHRESMRSYAALFKLSGMMKRIEKLLGENR